MNLTRDEVERVRRELMEHAPVRGHRAVREDAADMLRTLAAENAALREENNRLMGVLEMIADLAERPECNSTIQPIPLYSPLPPQERIERLENTRRFIAQSARAGLDRDAEMTDRERQIHAAIAQALYTHTVGENSDPVDLPPRHPVVKRMDSMDGGE